MSLLVMESFAWTNVIADLAGRYNMSTFAASINPSGGRFGTGGMTTNSEIIWPIPSLPTQQCSGFAVEMATPGDANQDIYRVYGAAGVHISLATDIVGHLIVIGPGGGTIGTSAYVMPPNVWQYIEIKCVINTPSNGSVEVFVEGSPVINLTGVTTQKGGSNQITGLSFYGNGRAIGVSDYYVKDSLTPLGPSRCIILTPASDGDDLQWTPSTGLTHFNLVDTIPPDVTKYVSSLVPGNSDCYHFTSLPYVPAGITAIQPSWYAESTDAVPRAIKPLLRIAAMDFTGIQQFVATQYIDYIQIYETNPNTSAAWSAADVNNLQAGINESV